MPWYRMPDGVVAHVKLGGKRRAPVLCYACHCVGTLLCDGKFSGTPTCDAPMCEKHALEVGPDKHLCPVCVQAYRTWLRDQCIPQQ